MDQKEELSEDLRLSIVEQLKSGISQRQVAQTLGCVQSYVSKIWKKYCSTNDIKNLSRYGCPRVTSSGQDRKLVNSSMTQDKKLTFIPEELTIKHTVSNKRLSELDKLMVEILNSDLHDQEKLTRYHRVLQTSLNLQEFNQPILKQFQTSETFSNQAKKDNEEIKMDKKDQSQDITDEAEKKPPQINYQDLILPSIPKNMRGKAASVLDLIKNQPDILSWGSKGQLIANKEEIPNTNIIDFFGHLYKSRKNTPHHVIYDKALKDLNIPKYFIGNKNIVLSPEKKKVVNIPIRKPVKRLIKPAIKWEKY